MRATTGFLDGVIQYYVMGDDPSDSDDVFVNFGSVNIRKNIVDKVIIIYIPYLSMARWILIHGNNVLSITTGIDLPPHKMFKAIAKAQSCRKRITLTTFPIDVEFFTHVNSIRCDVNDNDLCHVFFYFHGDSLSIYLEGKNVLMSVVSVIHAYSIASFREIVPRQLAVRTMTLFSFEISRKYYYNPFDYMYPYVEGTDFALEVEVEESPQLQFDVEGSALKILRRAFTSVMTAHVQTLPRDIWAMISEYIIP